MCFEIERRQSHRLVQAAFQAVCGIGHGQIGPTAFSINEWQLEWCVRAFMKGYSGMDIILMLDICQSLGNICKISSKWQENTLYIPLTVFSMCLFLVIHE